MLPSSGQPASTACSVVGRLAGHPATMFVTLRKKEMRRVPASLGTKDPTPALLTNSVVRHFRFEIVSCRWAVIHTILAESFVASTDGHICTDVASTACHVGITLLMALAFLSACSFMPLMLPTAACASHLSQGFRHARSLRDDVIVQATQHLMHWSSS